MRNGTLFLKFGTELSSSSLPVTFKLFLPSISSIPTLTTPHSSYTVSPATLVLCPLPFRTLVHLALSSFHSQMSTEVATPAVIPTEPTATTTATESPAVFVEEEETPKVVEQVESKTETPSTPTATSKEEHKKRSPFGDLKNKLFNKVSLSVYQVRESWVRFEGVGKGVSVSSEGEMRVMRRTRDQVMVLRNARRTSSASSSSFANPFYPLLPYLPLGLVAHRTFLLPFLLHSFDDDKRTMQSFFFTGIYALSENSKLSIVSHLLTRTSSSK